MAPSEQKVLWWHELKGPLKVETREVPTPQAGWVLVKIEASALNPVDNYSHQAGYFVDDYPYIAGNDGSGTVEEVGEGVTELSKGDRVVFQAKFGEHRGTFQQYVLVDIPDNVSFDGAATIPLGLATAAIGLYQKIGKRGGAELTHPWVPGGRGKYAGQAAFVVGGASSVGQYAIQLARLSGFSPIITTASASNEAYCLAAGATHVIDYHTTPYTAVPAAIQQITKAPIALAYDAISSADSQKASWEILGPNGNFVITLPAAVSTPAETDELGRRTVWVYGTVQDPENEEFGKELYAALPALLADGSIKPNKVEYVPDGLKGIPAALERLAKGVSGIKLVARPGETP
ncbi:GroES-like protein [Gloeopeniophorella convolvens]|nr:GroES-like protein [Gloeopeniophorella convolvens]